MSAISDYVTISVFASLVGVPVGITSTAVRIKICAITPRTRIKKYKSISRKSMIK